MTRKSILDIWMYTTNILTIYSVTYYLDWYKCYIGTVPGNSNNIIQLYIDVSVLYKYQLHCQQRDLLSGLKDVVDIIIYSYSFVKPIEKHREN